MNNHENMTPLLSETSMIILILGILFSLIVGGVTAAIILIKRPSETDTKKSNKSIHAFTIFLIVFSVVILALQRILSGELTASILSGIAGYVLGASKKEQ